ncbi:Methionine synthase reductase [Lamellibrachia satsuma]|nr:Methionine synthase reductase [Lamellibrachia satsuma]
MEDYTKYIREPSLCLQDVLVAFPSCSPPVDVILEHLPRLQARAYSAASSSLATPGRFTFVFNIVEFPQCHGRSKARHGVCTGWLDKLTRSLQATPDLSDLHEEMSLLNLNELIKIRVYPRSNLHFHPPDDLSVPLIMIGPGTGVAPFVGFLMHRQMLISGDTNIGETWLFFGCRHADCDFLYRSELEGLQASGALSRLMVSFSRDSASKQGEPRYVQDNLRCHGAEIATLLREGGATVFVCGDAKHMAKDVTDAIVCLLQRHTDMEKKEAEDYVLQLRHNKRYVEDVWM